MAVISFTLQARKDLKEINQYISLQSPLQAQRVTEKIIQEIQKLAVRPQFIENNPGLQGFFEE